MTIRCERCGKEINTEDSYAVKIERYGRVEKRTLCEDCKSLSEAFMTAAYIPGISKTQYELLLYMARNVEHKTPADKFKDLVEDLKKSGMTVPEIAKEIGVCNQCVMRLVKNQL